MKLAERNVKCIWENTPTPPPEQRPALENGHANGPKKDVRQVHQICSTKQKGLWSSEIPH